jgi:chromosome segregation ATPase
MSQIIALLIIVGVIGFFIGHLWTRRRSVDSWARNRERLESKVRGYERDLERSRAELKPLRDQVASLKNELANSVNSLKARDGQVGILESKLNTVADLEAELSVKESTVKELTTEVNSLRSRLAKAEADLKKPLEPNPALNSEINMLKQKLAGRDGEISTLLNRVKELAPLNLQIKDRDLRLRESEARYTAALKDKDGEIASLNERLRRLSDSQELADSKDERITSLTSRIAELEARLKSVNGSQAESSLITGANRHDAGDLIE